MEVNNSACDYANDALLKNLIRPLFVEILLKIRIKYPFLGAAKNFQNSEFRNNHFFVLLNIYNYRLITS